MTVQQEDLTFLQSEDVGSAGGAVSGVEIVSGVDNNLIPDITEPEATAGGTLYRKWFMRNDHVEDTLPDYGIWVAAEPDEVAEAMAVGINDTDDDAGDPLLWDLTPLTGDALIELSSDGPDTRQVRLCGLNTAGDPVEELVTLNGTAPVLSVVTFSALYAASVASGSQIVTIKEGSGGTTRGTLPATSVLNALWYEPASLSTAIKRVALAPGEVHGYWSRYVWDPGTPEQLDNFSAIAVQRLPS